MKGTLRSTDERTYVVHEIATTGTVVREYVSPAGVVFGVAWEGQAPPDFQQLLGPYYEQAKQAGSQQQAASEHPASEARADRHPTPGLVFQQTGHLRSFHGVAYIPAIVAHYRPGQRHPLRRQSSANNRILDGGDHSGHAGRLRFEQ